jgi:hypothetical protein
MSDRWQDVGDPQTAFKQAKGELRPKANLPAQNAPQSLLDPTHQAISRRRNPTPCHIGARMAKHPPA